MRVKHIDIVNATDSENPVDDDFSQGCISCEF